MRLRKISTFLVTYRRWIIRIGIIAILLITIWLYFPPYINSFIGDDYVQQWRIREFLDSPVRAYRIFNPFWTNWYYRPLQNLWFLGNRLLFGLNPAGSYYLQLTWHLLTIALIFQISRRLRVGAYAALGAAAFFAISGQHQLVVGWISSIGNIVCTTCSLAAVAAYLTYLEQPNRRFPLVLTFLFFLLALLAHEEGFILPLFLLVARLLWPTRPPVKRMEVLIGMVILFSMVLYAAVQIIRPNANLSLGGAYPTIFYNALSPINSGHFFVELIRMWLPFGEYSGAMEAFGEIGDLPLVSVFVTVLVLGLLVYGIFKGSLAIRLGLIWTALNLGFVYVVLWGQRPDLFDSRHVYTAWVGMSLVFGGLPQLLYEIYNPKPRAWLLNQAAPLFMVGCLLVISLWLQSERTRQVQKGLLAHTKLVDESKNQLLALLPTVTDSTRLFAYRFILTPPYFIPAAEVWYDDPGLNGGTLDFLKDYAEVSSDFYLFDYADGFFYNLLPDLQEHRRTILLWRKSPNNISWLYENNKAEAVDPGQFETDTVVGPMNDRRLSIKVLPKPQAWMSLTYEETVPPGGQLAVSVLPEPGNIYRIRAFDQDGVESVLFSHAWESDSVAKWQDIMLPLDSFAGQTINISFDYRGSLDNQNPGYWSNPRIVVD